MSPLPQNELHAILKHWLENMQHNHAHKKVAAASQVRSELKQVHFWTYYWAGWSTERASVQPATSPQKSGVAVTWTTYSTSLRSASRSSCTYTADKIQSQHSQKQKCSLLHFCSSIKSSTTMSSFRNNQLTNTDLSLAKIATANTYTVHLAAKQ